ncbi:MAG: hypothetical protein MZV70_71985 [Desulfobacterales bacterium]|nr:hypothetical protein [Desulfobacterales bacterium]
MFENDVSGIVETIRRLQGQDLRRDRSPQADLAHRPAAGAQAARRPSSPTVCRISAPTRTP